MQDDIAFFQNIAIITDRQSEFDALFCYNGVKNPYAEWCVRARYGSKPSYFSYPNVKEENTGTNGGI